MHTDLFTSPLSVINIVIFACAQVGAFLQRVGDLTAQHQALQARLQIYVYISVLVKSGLYRAVRQHMCCPQGRSSSPF